jgi:hypothetical protein
MKLDPDYPRMMFHPTKNWVIVKSAEEEEALGPEWSRTTPGPELSQKDAKTKRDAKGRYVERK